MSTPSPSNFDPTDRRIRLPEVLLMTGLSKRTVYRRIEDGKFPKPEKDGRISAWWLSKVRAYIGLNPGGQTP